MSKGLIPHLVELRQRLLVVFAAVGVGAVLTYQVKEPALQWVLQPLTAYSPGVIVTGIPDIFFMYLRLAVYGGVLLGFPVLLWQIWLFMKPGLLPAERKVIGSLFLVAPLLLYGGAVFAHQLVLPLVLEFFFSFQNYQLHNLPALQPVVSFILKLMMAFAVAFTLPLWVLLFLKLGWVTPAALRQGRKYVLVLIFIAAAILTPPDPASQLLLALPLYVLYEVGVLLGRFVNKTSPNS